MIVVIDYDIGNVKSVCNAFRHIGCQVKLSNSIKDIERASGLVLPGVAAYGYAVNALGDTAKVVKENAENGKPLLGICVGFQLLFEESCEHGRHKGLALIAGSVISLPKKKIVPHMGWNLVQFPENMQLFNNFENGRYFYFAHSYYADITDKEAEIAYTDYGFNLAAAVQKKNIFGTQFHPEKSGKQGLKVLGNFARIAERGF